MTNKQMNDLEETVAYTTEGSIRGPCGHRHRTVEAATLCCVRDERGCRSRDGWGAYSDRQVVAVLADDTTRALTAGELGQEYEKRCSLGDA